MKTYSLTDKFLYKKFSNKMAIVFLLVSAGITLVTTGYAQKNKTSPGNFYAVTGNGIKDTSWIFGTYHLVKSSYLAEIPAVVKAFNRSKGIVVEMIMDSTKLSMASSMGMMKENVLSDLLDKPFKDSLDNELKTTMGIGIAQINQQKPINVALTLSLIYVMADNASPLKKYTGSYLDGYFAETGKQSGKNITGLETLEEQMDLMFNKSSNEEQVKMLKYFFRNKTEMISQGNELITHWFNHDLDKMYAVSEKSLIHFGNSDDLLKNRNDNWMQVLPGLLSKESQFIAVGALHLAGPGGLINQLQQMGYTLTPVKL